MIAQLGCWLPEGRAFEWLYRWLASPKGLAWVDTAGRWRYTLTYLCDDGDLPKAWAFA